MNLKRGDKGIEVVKLQQKLLEFEYALPRYGADGDFGLETETAVKRLQTDSGLPVTGIVDEGTMNMLYGGAVYTPAPNTASDPMASSAASRPPASGGIPPILSIKKLILGLSPMPAALLVAGLLFGISYMIKKQPKGRT